MLNPSLAVLGVAAKVKFPTVLCYDKLFSRFVTQELVLRSVKNNKFVHKFQQITGVMWKKNDISIAYLLESVQHCT